ncbi:hypothetical protein JCM1840_005218 [Sporobolomyces johnsonii]
MAGASIPSLAASSFDASLSAGHIHLYQHSTAHPVPVPGAHGDAQHFIHVVPGLNDKPAVPFKTPELGKKGAKDVFAGPDFGPGEKILDLSSSDGAPYALVHNLHALMPEHFMAIPHFGDERPFRPQTSDLRESDLEVAWRVVEAYQEDGRETVCFFNGGPLAGASQAHLHLQFAPFQHGVPPLPEAVARSLELPLPSSPSSTPLVSRLPLPWVSFVTRLPTSPSLSSLVAAYAALLATLQPFLSSRPPSLLPPAGDLRNSYNLFLTSQHMHLVPRTDRLVRIRRERSQGQGASGGGWEGQPGEEREMRLSVNGLLYLGWWYVGTEEEAADLRAHGVARTLVEAGYENEEYEGA